MIQATIGMAGAILAESTLSFLGLQFGTLLAGTIVTETIFSWPGIGRLTVQAISSRDYPLLQGCILVIAVPYVAVNLLTDQPINIAANYVVQNATPDAPGPQLILRRIPWTGVMESRPVILPAPKAQPAGK